MHIVSIYHIFDGITSRPCIYIYINIYLCMYMYINYVHTYILACMLCLFSRNCDNVTNIYIYICICIFHRRSVNIFCDIHVNIYFEKALRVV